MGILARSVAELKSGGTVDGSLELFRLLDGWRTTNSGASVSHKTALEVSTVLACARVIAEGIAQVADTPRGREMYQLMKMQPRPAIDGMSIGYIAKEWEPRTKPEDPRRRLKRIDLVEVSLVTRPANGKARVASVKGADMTERDFERLLTRDAGLSRSEAQVVINQGFKSLIAMRDAGSSELAELYEAVKARGQFIPR